MKYGCNKGVTSWVLNVAMSAVRWLHFDGRSGVYKTNGADVIPAPSTQLVDEATSIPLNIRGTWWKSGTLVHTCNFVNPNV